MLPFASEAMCHLAHSLTRSPDPINRENRMSSILRSAKVPAHTLALLITASSAAAAQLGDYDPALEFPGLSQATLNGMHAAAAKLYLYERQPVGTVETWTSPDGTSGEVKLVRSFDSSNMPCRTIDYTIDSQGTGRGLNPHDYILTWCRLPGGTWKIVEVPPPR